jgi:class 3 adenylate cyclase
MAKLSAAERAALPDAAFAYIDSKGDRRLPIHDEAHARNALARFNQVRFESDQAREAAFEKVLKAAMGYGIAPVGFVAGQLRRARSSTRPDLPEGQVTLMLTDIENSTGIAHRLGDAYPGLLTRVRSLIADLVTANSGYEVDARADDSFSVFPDAMHALETALALQRRLEDRPWSVPVRVRVGLHSGEPARSETGYEGIIVHTAARVCSAAHGGQILLSASARDELDADVSRVAKVLPLGAHRLRGLPEPLELFQALGPGLPDQFPPPRSESAGEAHLDQQPP